MLIYYHMIKVCHGYTVGTNFLNRTRTRQHRTRYGYGYIPHRNFCGVKRVPIKFNVIILKIFFKNTKKDSNGGEGVGVAAAAAATPAVPAFVHTRLPTLPAFVRTRTRTRLPSFVLAAPRPACLFALVLAPLFVLGVAPAAAPAPAVPLIALVRAFVRANPHYSVLIWPSFALICTRSFV